MTQESSQSHGSHDFLRLRGGESERERERERKFTEFPLFRLFGIIADCLLAVKY